MEQVRSLKTIMKNKDYRISIKRKVFNMCILPILTYGCQTWAATEKMSQKLITCQRGMERSILGYTKRDRKRATEIREVTKLEDVTRKAKTLKWKWAGHMLREKQKWSNILTEWTPRYNTKRKRGRQYKRWSDELKKTAGPLWTRLARDREAWKAMEEAFVSKRHVEPTVVANT